MSLSRLSCLSRGLPALNRTSKRHLASINKLKSQSKGSNSNSQSETSKFLNVPFTEEDLFHPLSSSPFPHLTKRAKIIKKHAPCPVCLSEDEKHRNVKHECPDCG